MKQLPGTECLTCGEIIGVVGHTLGSASVELYGCRSCLELGIMAPNAMEFLAKSLLQDPAVSIVGVIFMGGAFRLQDGSLVPVAHPDDVWG